jgi:hypothetical protein
MLGRAGSLTAKLELINIMHDGGNLKGVYIHYIQIASSYMASTIRLQCDEKAPARPVGLAIWLLFDMRQDFQRVIVRSI